ncbi:NAD binding Rossmann fold oxidoreductase [Meredithblackwellia eburnea MCA 4105]
MAAQSPIKVAVLGFGMSATVFHIPFIQHCPEFQLVSIFERKATAEKSAARDAYPQIKVVNTLQQILDDKEVELVFVSTINDTHLEYSKACLEAGKHVVVEKPLTPTSSEAWELAKLAKEKDLVLAVYQNRRWDSDFLTVKGLLDQGVFGELSEFESHYDRFKNEPATTKLWKEEPRAGSGSVYDLGSHLIDQLLYLFGKPSRVTGIVRNSRLIGQVSDSFHVTLHYDPSEEKGRKLPLLAVANGSILSLFAPQLRFSVKGTSAAFLKFGLDVQEEQLKSGGAAALAKEEFGVEPEELSGTLYKEGGKSEKVKTAKGAYVEWFKNVAEAVRSGDRSRLIVTPEQAALTIEVIEAAIKSSEEGKTVSL